MASDFPSWRFADRTALRERRSRQFMQGAGAGDDQRRLDQFMVSDETDNASAKKLLGGTYARRFDASMANNGLPAARPEKKGGGNPFGRALGAVKDFGGDAFEAGMTVLDAPRKYVGAPAFGILSGLNQSETYTDPETGRQYKKSASLKDVAQSLGEAVQHPIRAYEKGGESTEQYFADPDKNFAFRGVGRTVTDPLSYFGPGLASRVVKGVGASGKLARVGTELLDSGGPGVALGANLGSEAEQDYGERVPGWNKLSPQARSLIAGVLGGTVGGKVHSEMVGKGKVGLSIRDEHPHVESYADAMDRNGVDWQFDHEGFMRPANPEQAEQVASSLLNEASARAENVRGQWVGGGRELDKQFGSGTPRGSGSFASKRGEASAAINKLADDGERIYEVLDDAEIDPKREALRQPFAEGDTLANFQQLDPALGDTKTFQAEWDKLVDAKQATSKRGRETGSRLGISKADDFVAERLRPDYAPSGLLRDIYTEIEATQIWEGRPVKEKTVGASGVPETVGRKVSAVDEAYIGRLREIAADLETRGRDAILPRDGVRSEAPAGDVPGVGADTGRIGVEEASRASETVKRKDIFGNVTDTYQTEAELAGIRAEQGDLFGRGDAEAKRAAFESGEPTARPTEAKTLDVATEGPQAGEAPPREEPASEPKAEPNEPKAEPNEPPPPLDRADDWSILGLKKGEQYSESDLRRAYREQMRRYHPDVNSSETATKDAQDINGAFSRLMKGQGQTHGTSGARTGDDYREQARRDRRTRDEQQQANDEARQRRQERENPPPGGGPSGPSSEDWYAAWGSTPPGTKPPGGEPPKPKGPEFKHFGQDDRYDLFNAESRSEQIRKQEAYLKSLRGRLNQAIRNVVKGLGGEKFDKNLILDTLVRPFVVGEKGRTDNLINHWTAWAREEAETKMRRAGITVAKAEDGSWRINGDGTLPTIEDVIERSTPEGRAFYEQLTPEQREAVDFIEWANEAANKTILAHGGEVPVDPDIQGSYFPRKVAGVDGQERTSGGSSFKKSRTMESLEEGLRGDVDYANPWDAFEAGMRGKLRHAQDSYMRETLKPLSVKPDKAAGIRNGFGYDYVDHHALNGMLFPQDVADRIKSALNPPSDNIFTKLPKGLNSVLTPLRATGDFSASLQQGMVAWLRNPAKAADHWRATVVSLKDPEAYFKSIDKLEKDGPGLNEHIRWGGHYVNPHSTDDFLMPKVAAKLSGGKWEQIPIGGKIAQKSNEHFARFLNLVRFDMGNAAYARAKALGLEGQALDSHMREAWNSINRASGWTGRKPTTLESIGAFAPRYLSASIEQLAAAVSKGGIEGKLARDHMLRLMATGTALAWMINTARGKETEFDPRGSNFLRIRDVGGLDVSVFGTYDTLIRAIAGTVGGKSGGPLSPDLTRPVKFGESKLSPAAKLLYEPFIAKETYLGEPLDPSTPGGLAKIGVEQLKSSLPFNVQDAWEEGPVAGLVGSSGLSARLQTESEKLNAERNDQAKKLFGKFYDDLSGAEKSQVNETAGVSKIQSAKDAQDLRRGGDSASRVRIRQQFQEQMAANARYLAAGKDDAGNVFSGNDYREAYHELQTYLAGQRDTLKDFSGGDKEVDGWFDLYDQAKLANGQMDSEKLDQLQAAYLAAHPGIEDRVDQVIGIHDDATLREYRKAQKEAAEYYKIPAYVGMSLSDAQRASEVLRLAAGMVQAGEARNQRHAFSMLMQFDSRGVMLARQAQSRGGNPKRKAFRTSHPLFGRFYTDSASVIP